MKVSRAQKQENHDRFIGAFVLEVSERSYSAVTLKDVARRAGLAEGGIYKYFASKEKLLLAYYAQKMDRLRIESESLHKKTDYSLVDKLQALLEFQLAQYKDEKDFLKKTFQPTFVAAGLMWTEVMAIRKVYIGIVRTILESAAAKGEIPELVWSAVIDEIAWCHYLAVINYWQQDKSKHNEDTSQFIDRSLQLFSALISGRVLHQAQELVGFLINRHVLPLMLNFGMPGLSIFKQPGAFNQPPASKQPPVDMSTPRSQKAKKSVLKKKTKRVRKKL